MQIIGFALFIPSPIFYPILLFVLYCTTKFASSLLSIVRPSHAIKPSIHPSAISESANGTMSSSSVSLDSYNLRTRQLIRRITRDTLGVGISGTLSIAQPWMVPATGLSLRRVFKNAKKLGRMFKKEEHRVRKRDVVRGVVEGTVIKAVTATLFLGQDDVALAAQEIFDDTVDLQEVEGINNDRVGLGPVEVTSGAAGAPVEALQGAMDLDTSKSLVQEGVQGGVERGGWDAPAAEVAQQIVVVGAVQAGVERASDTLLEKPFDRGVDYSSSRRIPGAWKD